MVDLDVYQRAGEAVRSGAQVYEHGGDRLVFTYPPFAALVSVVITPFGQWAAQFVWTVASVAALAGVVVLSFRPLLHRFRSELRPLVAGGLVVVVVLSHPFVEHVFYGQVNVFLVLLCLADLLVRHRRWPTGVLVGVATALKLTPAVFIVHLWITRRRRAALTAAGAALACTAFAAAVLPSASADYWANEVFEGERVTGAVTYTSNQSLLGLVSRLVGSDVATVPWLLAGLVVALFGFARARTAHDEGDERGGIALVSLLAVLLSPVAWIHHGVWFVPVIGALVADGRDRARCVAAGAVTFVLLLRLPWWGWSLLDEGPVFGIAGVLAHNAYALLALALLIGYPVATSRSASTPPVASRHGRTWRNRTDRPLPTGSRD